MGEKRNAQRALWGILEERDYLEVRGIDRRIILKCIFKEHRV
jgi:hypothetical protein